MLLILTCWIDLKERWHYRSWVSPFQNVAKPGSLVYVDSWTRSDVGIWWKWRPHKLKKFESRQMISIGPLVALQLLYKTSKNLKIVKNILLVIMYICLFDGLSASLSPRGDVAPVRSRNTWVIGMKPRISNNYRTFIAIFIRISTLPAKIKHCGSESTQVCNSNGK